MSITYSRNAEVAGSVPSVNIATHNNRKKRYNSETNKPIYYLNHNDEFQIELYNPTQHVVRCDISLNGKKLRGGGLVLKPAERVFLDRYFDSTQKFLFETYEVGNSSTDKKAIELNGSVKVEFYKETHYTINHTPFNVYTYYGSTNTPYVYGTCTSTSGTVTTGNSTTTNITSGATTNTMFFDTTSLNTHPSQLLTDSPDPIRSFKKTETGRIGKGDVSKQTFTNVHYDFDYSPFYTVEYKIIPYSQKPQTLNTVNVTRYCTECGSKSKPNFKFCPNCGTKI